MPQLRARPRRRRVDGLTRAEADYLRTGHTPYLEPGSSAGFLARDAAGEYHVDEAAMARSWRQHRDQLLAETMRHGLIPWAARQLEGMAGRVSPYEHIRPRPDEVPAPWDSGASGARPAAAAPANSTGPAAATPPASEGATPLPSTRPPRPSATRR
jgi:hypothetical protein